MKFREVIISLILVLALLALISLVFPKDGIRIVGMDLKFPSVRELFLNEKPRYANLEKIIDENTSLSNSIGDTSSVGIKDDGVVKLEFANNDVTLLDDFFSSLDNVAKGGRSVRIVHYGDSQIEGDRITSYLRQKLQKSFGGVGQGEIPLHSTSDVANVSYDYSPNFHFYSIIDLKHRGYSDYGLMQNAVVPYTRTIVDSINMSSKTYSKGIINLKLLKSVKGKMTLYFTNPNTKSTITIMDKQNVVAQKSIEVTKDLDNITFYIDRATKHLNITTEGSPELLSLDMSAENGVYVDNVSLRGSSGYGFMRNNTLLLNAMSENMNVRLIILQFGVNVIPQDGSKRIKDYGFYRKKFSQQIAFLKSHNPKAQIIVVGVSDRSVKSGSNYVTNPNVKKLIAAQKAAAFENNCIFWNLFQAMGGENSMPSWVLREHPLANPDFVHFNAYGAKYVAQMLYSSIERAYKDYRKRK